MLSRIFSISVNEINPNLVSSAIAFFINVVHSSIRLAVSRFFFFPSSSGRGIEDCLLSCLYICLLFFLGTSGFE